MKNPGPRLYCFFTDYFRDSTGPGECKWRRTTFRFPTLAGGACLWRNMWMWIWIRSHTTFGPAYKYFFSTKSSGFNHYGISFSRFHYKPKTHFNPWPGTGSSWSYWICCRTRLLYIPVSKIIFRSRTKFRHSSTIRGTQRAIWAGTFILCLFV
jgi:hypothetical protein